MTQLAQASLGGTFGINAAVLTLAALAQRSIVPMRIVAIGANISFIAYGGHYIQFSSYTLSCCP